MLAAPTDAQYAAMAARDARHDGWFIVAVTSTGIYCRPSCPARTPKREHVQIAPTAAAAQAAGFRACRRCRPDASPGSPQWDARGDVAGRAMRLIGDGVVDRDGVGGLAGRLGYSERQLHRILTAELGAGPLQLARAQRAQTARILIETTDLPMVQVALAAGFASLRQFNDTVRAIFATTPTELRQRRSKRLGTSLPGTVRVRLPYRPPLDLGGLWRFLAARELPGVELATADGFTRTLRLPRGHGVARLSAEPGSDAIELVLALDDLRDLAAGVARCRALLDLDADPSAVDAALGADPRFAASVGAAPGRRVPGAVDGLELAVRAVLGQQVSVAGARTLAGRLVDLAGDELTAESDEPRHLFPSAAALADADIASIGLPAARAETIRRLADLVAHDELHLAPGDDRDDAARALLGIPGIGPWTVEYVLMRALRDPDRFPAADLIVRQQLLGAHTSASPAAAARIAELAEPWRPWRSYALMHLWDPAAPLGPVSASSPTTARKPRVLEAA
ncbi:MAG: DNA-3-methyladenine glycosylase 2 family protein [Solirubrobacteraceae bacterium]|nr:DNA-3-methyladenine glycosylase 2 family protein [Solirubrobacteraceae bacterium]